MSVRLSVCHTPACVKTAKHILKLLSPSGSHSILVFQYQTLSQYSDFRPISRFISETVQYTAMFTTERQYELVCDLPNGDIFNDLE